MQNKIKDCHILKLISGREREVSFHTPGHKADFCYGRLFPAADMDVTELSYTDDLSSPSGVIAKAQADIAEIVGAKRSYILTDGSTSGVFAMMYAVRRKGKKIIVPRNCHKSVWNACALLGLEPVIVQGEECGGVMQPPSPEQIGRLICGDQSIAGLVVTSPDYYGNIAPLQEYSKVLRGNGRYLLIDGAHGGHLAYEEGRKGYAGLYADIWIDGAHKSMPALTQGSLVHLNDLSLQSSLEEGLNIFRTSSPSFPVMASVEYSVKYCDFARESTEKLKKAVCATRERIEEIGYNVYPSADWTKLAVDFAFAGKDASLANEYLEKNGIYAEFNDGRYILFYLSANTKISELKRLEEVLAEIYGADGLNADCFTRAEFSYGENSSYGYLNAVNAEYEYVDLQNAAGRIAAANAGISPPCIPVAAAGEIITPQVIELLIKAPHAFGVEGGKIKVVRKYEG
ncbi:MAG: aminotransferase class I/II-fold pyridoxal phosphate-dependent enzyme [Clostridia bacterium]|nr:aminotransferase class I/II-fold pyridoxal phosphate-dependent enzyme [Clostridia bacterium]